MSNDILPPLAKSITQGRQFVTQKSAQRYAGLWSAQYLKGDPQYRAECQENDAAWYVKAEWLAPNGSWVRKGWVK